MAMITSIRAPIPVAETPHATIEPRARSVSVGTAAPVTETALMQAVQQPATKAATTDACLLEARITADTSAAAAAEAARDAYIKASIAAGISPLPLP